MNKMGMIWCIAGPELCELILPLGRSTPVEIVRAMTSKSNVRVDEILEMLKREATTLH